MAGSNFTRYPLDIGRYYMASHIKDSDLNPIRFELLETTDARNKIDGLNTLKYEVKHISKQKLFTRVKVSYSQHELSKKPLEVHNKFRPHASQSFHYYSYLLFGLFAFIGFKKKIHRIIFSFYHSKRFFFFYFG